MNEREELSMLKSLWKGKFSGSYTSADARYRYCRSLVRRANRHRMSSRITAPDRSIEKQIRELNIRIKLLETRITENKKRVIKLYCTPSKDFIRPATISTEWADNIEGGLVVDPIAVEIIDGLGAYTEAQINRVQTKVLLCLWMVFMDATRGFGFPLTPSELEGVNSARAEMGRTPLLCSPGKAWLSYGLNDEGYWNYDKFSVQVTEITDCFDYLYPGHQMLLEVDHSSGHTKKLPGGLCTDDMGLGIGGKKLAIRDTVIVEGCLGETLVYIATWMDETVEREVRISRTETSDKTYSRGEDFT